MKVFEIEQTSIVVLGRFTPSLFSPSWMRFHNLFGEDETRNSTVEVIIPPLAVFATDWMKMEVREDRLVVTTMMSQEVGRLRDLAIGLFRILSETPVSAMGINRDVHWSTPTGDHYHALGDSLAPKTFWTKAMKLPGMTSLTVQGVRDDGWLGHVQMTVQPSITIKPYGLYSQVNDHFSLRRTEKNLESRSDFESLRTEDLFVEPSAENVKMILEILGKSWDQRLEETDRMLSKLYQFSMTGSDNDN